MSRIRIASLGLSGCLLIMASFAALLLAGVLLFGNYGAIGPEDLTPVHEIVTTVIVSGILFVGSMVAFGCLVKTISSRRRKREAAD